MCDELIIEYHQYARNIARAYIDMSPDHIKDDIVSEALYGLVKAARKFVPNGNTKFKTYATYWIRGSIQTYFRNLSTDRDRQGISLEELDEIVIGREMSDEVAEVDAFDNLLRGLSPRQAEACRLIYQQDMNISEAAKAMGASKQAVHSLDRKALAKLKKRKISDVRPTDHRLPTICLQPRQEV